MDSSPRGPLIVTVGLCCCGVKRPIFGAFGKVTAKSTFSGMESGARPICDWVGVEEEKALQAIAGMAADAEVTEEAARSALRDVESMAAARVWIRC